MNKLYRGDCLKILRRLPDESVQCCVTSPPYWGLRDYGTGKWQGGDAECDHRKLAYPPGTPTPGGRGGSMPMQEAVQKERCSRCGARRIDQQLGLEATPESYVARMVEVFREVRRVLRPDGTLWLNIGDSYAAGKCGRDDSGGNGRFGGPRITPSQRSAPDGLKSKDLVGIPWRLAFALQADGWYLRSDIIWHKPNPMPESVRDRPTKAHEYVFLLTKSSRYFWDAEAVREPHVEPWRGNGDPAKYGGSSNYRRGGPGVRTGTLNSADANGAQRVYNPAGRNIRSVWTITPKPFRGAHFATFPPALVERCVKAGTSERGCCPHCGKAWERVTDREQDTLRPKSRPVGNSRGISASDFRAIGGPQQGSQIVRVSTLGFRPACTCPAAKPVPCVVLDPFIGSGTTAAVAKALGRDCVGIDLNPKYLTMARQRVKVALCG